MLRCLIVCGAERCLEEVNGCATSCVLRTLSRDDSRCNECNLMPQNKNTHPPQLPGIDGKVIYLFDKCEFLIFLCRF